MAEEEGMEWNTSFMTNNCFYQIEQTIKLRDLIIFQGSNMSCILYFQVAITDPGPIKPDGARSIRLRHGKVKNLLPSLVLFNIIILFCNLLYCIVLYCIVLYCIVLYCIVLYCIVLYCIVLYCIVLYCIV